MNKIVVYDLDGTLLDVSERLNKAKEEAGVQDLDNATDEEYEKVMSIFNSVKYIDFDKPKENVVNQLRQEANKYGVFIMTGRTKDMSRATKNQLNEFDIPYDEIIHVNENLRDVNQTAENKALEIKKLSDNYEIIKFVDDEEENRKKVAEIIGEDKVFSPDTQNKVVRENKEKQYTNNKKTDDTPEQKITKFVLGIQDESE